MFSGSAVDIKPETSPEIEQAAMIESYLFGLEVTIPNQVVELWILGVKNRSGAVQYAMLSPSLKEKTRNQFEKRSWWTGLSSSWIDNVRFLKEDKISDTKVKYIVEYDLLTSNWKWDKKGRKVITVGKNPKQIIPGWVHILVIPESGAFL